MFHQLPEKLEAFREATAPPFRRRRCEEVLVHARESCSSQFRGSHDVETPASRRTRRNPHSTSSKLAAGSSGVPPRMFARILASEFILDIKATSARCIMLTHTHIQTRAPTRPVYVVVRAPIGANGPTLFRLSLPWIPVVITWRRDAALR